MEEGNNFQIEKVQPQGSASIFCLIFCQFQPGVAYESVTYKKVCVGFYWIKLVKKHKKEENIKKLGIMLNFGQNWVTFLV